MKKYIVLLLSVSIISCTQNERVKSYGGHSEIQLPANTKLINVTWKDSDLWYLTRPMSAMDTPEVYEFSEKSTFGIMQGSLTSVVKYNISYYTAIIIYE